MPSKDTDIYRNTRLQREGAPGPVQEARNCWHPRDPGLSRPSLVYYLLLSVRSLHMLIVVARPSCSLEIGANQREVGPSRENIFQNLISGILYI